MELTGSSLHARIFGIGSDILDCTMDRLAVNYSMGAIGTRNHTISDGSNLRIGG